MICVTRPFLAMVAVLLGFASSAWAANQPGCTGCNHTHTTNEIVSGFGQVAEPKFYVHRQECDISQIVNIPQNERERGMRTMVNRCGFRNLIQQARREPGGCNQANLDRVACENSPYRGMNLEQRFEATMQRARTVAGAYNVEGRPRLDYRAAVCIFARETEFMEPLRLPASACSNGTMWGMGAVVRDTYHGVMANGEFNRRALPPFNEPPFMTEHVDLWRGRTLNAQQRQALDLGHNALALSVDFQIETIFAILSSKFEGNGYQRAFENYNGTSDKAAYGRAVMDCYRCLKGAPTRGGEPNFNAPTGQAGVSCLDKVYPSRSLRQGFELWSQRSCRPRPQSSDEDLIAEAGDEPLPAARQGRPQPNGVQPTNGARPAVRPQQRAPQRSTPAPRPARQGRRR